MQHAFARVTKTATINYTWNLMKHFIEGRTRKSKKENNHNNERKKNCVSKRRTATNWNKSGERIDKWKTKRSLKAKLSTQEYTMHTVQLHAIHNLILLWNRACSLFPFLSFYFVFCLEWIAYHAIRYYRTKCEERKKSRRKMKERKMYVVEEKPNGEKENKNRKHNNFNEPTTTK